MRIITTKTTWVEVEDSGGKKTTTKHFEVDLVNLVDLLKKIVECLPKRRP